MLTYVKAWSENKKLGGMATVYRTLGSCPSTCFHHPDNNGTCYGLFGPGGMGPFRLADKYAKDDLADFRALKDSLPLNGMLRLGVVGDFLQDDETPDWEYIAACNDLAHARPDVLIIAYTHAWDGYGLSPADFDFTVNASCETPEQVEKATAAGWTPVLTLTTQEDPLIGQRMAGRRVIACPETYDDRVKCSNCRLCTKSDRPTIVGFPAHGTRKRRAREALAR